jgi:GntR family transcriptional repressor for pyruvate dehydrogenase complex
MEWKPPKKSRLLSDQVAEQIEQHIQREGLRAGDKVGTGRSLAEAYGVSRTVIRDALAALQERGLVEQRPGVGVFLRDGSSEVVANLFGQMLRLDAVDLPELIEARFLIEEHNASAAARNATPEILERLQTIIDQMRAARTGRRFIEADTSFHQALAEAAGNRVLAAVLRGLQPLLLDAMTLGLSVESATKTALSDHQAIVDAIERHDAPAAHMAMRVHLLHGRRELELAGSLMPRR